METITVNQFRDSLREQVEKVLRRRISVRSIVFEGDTWDAYEVEPLR